MFELFRNPVNTKVHYHSYLICSENNISFQLRKFTNNMCFLCAYTYTESFKKDFLTFKCHLSETIIMKQIMCLMGRSGISVKLLRKLLQF